VRDAILHPGVVQGKDAGDVTEWNALAHSMGDAEEVITADARALELRARRALQEYNLNADGIGYAVQGYVLPGGQIPAVKLLEHLVLADAIHAAENEKLRDIQNGRH
jgi:hypothetical protein